ncbi:MULTISPECIES: hypothetical protein [Streptomyces]|uniref:Uncharacterized protein n=1 Tax=Streptomyces doudnae TaxID=3075536 RepID=A0ABD5EPC6_9ACTN|nr:MULTISPECIES: hypothetical protein [unclassified Streptomyces]MDT0435680.1 hypothetical protein [Streptomyces sp. DSM 41981]SCD41130.1 hypothetical protein GA0115242_1048140 [Streptomyces sp. SolWspMP-5a-2]
MTAPDSQHPRPPVCGHWIGAERRHCLARQDLREYLSGLRCPRHTPAKLANAPEPVPGAGLPAGAWTTPSPQSASAVFDEAAIRSGKRRSSPHVYRAALDAQRPQRE